MFSVELLPDPVQTQVRETVSGFFFWYKRSSNPRLAHGGCNAKGFQRTSYDASSITENQLETMHTMEEMTGHVG